MSMVARLNPGAFNLSAGPGLKSDIGMRLRITVI